jgi:hypothetical protein
VLVHARALLTSHLHGRTEYIQADVRDTESILVGAVRTLDLTKPVGLMMLGILGNVEEYDEARSIVGRFVAALSAGSYLVINDGTNIVNPDARNLGRRHDGSRRLGEHSSTLSARRRRRLLTVVAVAGSPALP